MSNPFTHLSSSRFLRLFLFSFCLIILPATYLILSNSTPSPESTLDSLTGSSLAQGSVDLQDRLSPVLLLDSPPTLEGGHGKSSGGGWAEGGTALDSVVSGGVMMPGLGNETARAELGRATWKLLHLMTLRFPDEPTADQRSALKSYFYLFSRLYPCGECAVHFQELLKEYPPQTSSRKSASLWLCHLHNLINTRLLKPQFDCATLDSTYDCGCGDDPGKKSPVGEAGGEGEERERERDEVTGVELMRGGRR